MSLRKVRMLLEKHLKIHVELYCVQMLPCLWRHFLRLLTNPERMKTAYRIMAERVVCLERKGIRENQLCLQRLNLETEFQALSAAKRFEFLTTWSWSEQPKAERVRAKLASMIHA